MNPQKECQKALGLLGLCFTFSGLGFRVKAWGAAGARKPSKIWNGLSRFNAYPQGPKSQSFSGTVNPKGLGFRV